jgi:hypothetical protein
METKAVAEYRCRCNLTITGFTGDKTEFNPDQGQTVTFSGSVSEQYNNPVTWTVTVGGKTLNGSGPVVWDGTDASNQPVPAGNYIATMAAKTLDGVTCTDSKTLTVKVVHNAEVADDRDNNGDGRVDEGIWGGSCLNESN